MTRGKKPIAGGEKSNCDIARAPVCTVLVVAHYGYSIITQLQGMA
jgi:hypothetical protein